MDENSNNRTDFAKLLEQASALSQMLQSTRAAAVPDGTDEAEAAEPSADASIVGSVGKLMEAIRLFKTVSGASSGPYGEQPAAAVAAEASAANGTFDDRLYSPAIQAMKAAIPFLDQRCQRGLSMFVKLVEVQKLMELYGRPNAVFVQSAEGMNWQRGLLSAVRPHMDGERQNMLDLIVKLMEIKEILNYMGRDV